MLIRDMCVWTGILLSIARVVGRQKRFNALRMDRETLNNGKKNFYVFKRKRVRFNKRQVVPASFPVRVSQNSSLARGHEI